MSHGARRPTEGKQLDANRSCVAAGECRPRARSSKDTGRWCKGRVGIPHAFMWVPDTAWMGRWARDAEDLRWVHQRRECIGCFKHGSTWRARVFCGVCGSPERYFDTFKDTGEVVPVEWFDGWPRPHRWTTTHGPFCLCPQYFNQHAYIARRRWFSRYTGEWADDPEQIKSLRGFR